MIFFARIIFYGNFTLTPTLIVTPLLIRAINIFYDQTYIHTCIIHVLLKNFIILFL